MTKAEVQKYYNENKSKYGTPEKRNVEIILTKTEAAATSAKKEVESGKSFASVAKKVSIDPTSKSKGGLLAEVSKGQEEKALDAAIFSAATNTLSGPVKTPFGYYVFEVLGSTAGNQQTLAQGKHDQAAAQRHAASRAASASSSKNSRRSGRAKTECRAEYVVEDCKEYKDRQIDHRHGRRLDQPQRGSGLGGSPMSQIERIHARQILDSRGNPTVEVEVELRSGARGRAAVPSGASTGEFEATELRDGGERWQGKGVTRAVANVNGEIAQALAGADGGRAGGARPRADRARRHAQQVAPGRQRDPRRLAGGGARAGGRAAPAAVALPGRRAARVLPVPMMNVLNGGAHADNKVDFQEFMVVPCGARELLGVPAHGRGGLPRAEAHAARARPGAPRWATRAASRPT